MISQSRRLHEARRQRRDRNRVSVLKQFCARSSRAFGRPVGAAVIGDDNFVRQTSRQTIAHHGSDRLFFIQRWNDNGDLHPRTSQASVK